MNKDQYLHLLRSEFGYQSPPGQNLPVINFPAWLNFKYYFRLVSTLTHASIVGRRGDLDDEKWAWYSHKILKIVESVGGKVNISGLEGVAHRDGTKHRHRWTNQATHAVSGRRDLHGHLG
jgi:hypothetical protein